MGFFYTADTAASFVTCQLVIRSFCNETYGYILGYLSGLSLYDANDFDILGYYIYCVEK